MKKEKIDFSTILYLAEIYQDQYLERGLCLSPEQNEAYFRDFVAQYYSTLRLGKPIELKINTDIPLF